MCDEIDIYEDDIQRLSTDVLELLLTDHSRSRHRVSCGTHIIWATDDYKHLGSRYFFAHPITADIITGDNGRIIRPRVAKSHDVQQGRVRQRAEVFTPSWVCNAQNNLIDDAWFGRINVFNTENPDHTWTPSSGHIIFPEGRTWQDYVSATRMEMCCGEAPYLTSRYDAATGLAIPIGYRIGLLDRKLRIVSEHCDTTTAWLKAAYLALKNIYAFEWQGDNLFIAHENLLYSFIEAFQERFGRQPLLRSITYAAYIISWNIVQMDGLKFVVPESCHGELNGQQLNLFDTSPSQTSFCRGCTKGDPKLHNGIRVMVRDWSKPKERQVIPFFELLNH